ncbi:MAG: GGDEF domain-containing protein [Pseudomonadota bacterium]
MAADGTRQGEPREARSAQTELERLQVENAALRAELADMERRLDEARALADLDPLSSVLNRRAFLQALDRMLARRSRHGDPASLGFFDVDRLKEINDRYGHVAGDAVIARIGATLAEAVRRSDVAGRLGGDEFGVIFWRADTDDAFNSADRLVETLRAVQLEWRGAIIPLDVSFGVAELTSGARPEDVIQAADEAMYANKRSKRR